METKSEKKGERKSRGKHRATGVSAARAKVPETGFVWKTGSVERRVRDAGCFGCGEWRESKD